MFFLKKEVISFSRPGNRAPFFVCGDVVKNKGVGS